MKSRLFDGFKFGFGVILCFGLFFGIVFAIGFHSADEILSGTFRGNFVFEDSVSFKNELILSNNDTLSCTLSKEGALKYNSTSKRVLLCNGTAWNSFGSLTLDETIRRTCNEILTANPSASSGIYQIDVDGEGTGDPSFDVYCDMTTDGGGWTLIAYATDDSTQFGLFNTANGAWRPNTRDNIANINGVPIAKLSTEIMFSQNDANGKVGDIETYTRYGKYTIPDPSIVTFNSADAGNCVSVSYQIFSPSGITGTKYVNEKLLGISYSNFLYGLTDNSACNNFGSSTSISMPIGSTAIVYAWGFADASGYLDGSAAVWLR